MTPGYTIDQTAQRLQPQFVSYPVLEAQLSILRTEMRHEFEMWKHKWKIRLLGTFIAIVFILDLIIRIKHSR